MDQHTVLIVEDHRLVRTGLSRLLYEHPSISTVLEAESGEIAIDLARRVKKKNNCDIDSIDLVLMDLSLPGISGLETTRRLHKIDPTLRVVVLTGASDGYTTQRLLQAGALGYLTKGCTTTEMNEAIDAAFANEKYLSNDVARTVAMKLLKSEDTSPFTQLTQREHEIAMMLLDGKRNCQIGTSLFISEKTVSSHRARAFDKLGIHTTAELARLALQHGVWDIAAFSGR